MNDRKSSVRTLILTVTAALFVVVLIASIAFLASREQNRDKITLPSPDASANPPSLGDEADTGFVTVTRENAAAVVASLERPAFYHQSLSRQTLSGAETSTASVQIWAQGETTKLIVTESGQTRNVLTNGEIAYIWYSDASADVREISLPSDVTPDDLSGVLTYESILSLPKQAVLEAQYLQLPELGDAPCLFVTADDGDGAVSRFWVDLASGLLCRAECLQNGSTTYVISQTGLELLGETDSALAAQMRLPDGTVPMFSTEE